MHSIAFHLPFAHRENDLFGGRLSLLLNGDNLVVAHSIEHRHGIGLSSLKSLSDFAAEVIGEVGQLHILTAVAFLVHEGHEAILRDVHKGVLLSHNVGDVGSVGGRNDILVLLTSEDINGGEVALGMSVLASLGSGHGTHLNNK